MSSFNGWPRPKEGPDRDFVGYGRSLPKVKWPNGARVAVSLCLNYEEGSERSYPAGDNANDASGENTRVFLRASATSRPNPFSNTAAVPACSASCACSMTWA